MFKFTPFILIAVLMSACASNRPIPKAVAVAHTPPSHVLLATGFNRYFNTQTQDWEFPSDQSDR